MDFTVYIRHKRVHENIALLFMNCVMREIETAQFINECSKFAFGRDPARHGWVFGDVTLILWRLMSPITWLFGQWLVQNYIKSYITGQLVATFVLADRLASVGAGKTSTYPMMIMFWDLFF